MVKATHIKDIGSQLKIYYEDGSTGVAYPTQGGLWIVTLAEAPPPDGGGSEDGYSWPYSLDYVTSEFGPRGSGFHEGMDWSGGPALSGQPIPAIGDGTVSSILSGGGFGNGVILFHGNWHGYDWYSLYAHMSTTPAVGSGASVTKGQTLGPVGNTGNSYGAHLHMETHRVPTGGSLVWANNNPSWSAGRTAINPRNFMASYGDGGVLIP